MAVKITIVGAAGRMGSRIAELSFRDKDVEIVGLVEAVSHPLLGTKIFPNGPNLVCELESCIKDTDVVIDFSSPVFVDRNLKLVAESGKAVVIGTTGHNATQVDTIHMFSKKIPIVFSSNMSVGVNTLFKSLDLVLKILAEKDYDIEVIECHHNKKKDAPSGTAKKIMEIIKQHRPNAKFIYGREGMVGERTKNEVGVFAVRGGDIVGEHTIIIATDGERLELKHIATSRETFAKGAILAAKWVASKPAGLYSMYDVLGI